MSLERIWTLFRLAWRNIWRQRRRTSLLIAVVAYACLATIFFWSFNDGFNASILNNQARFLIAPMLVTSEAYHLDPNPENHLPDLAFSTDIASLANVAFVAPRLDFPALLRSPYASTGSHVRGVIPDLESRVSLVPENITQGRMLQSQGEVVLGSDLATRLDVRLDERLALDVSSLAGTQGKGLKVVGLIDSGLTAVDGRMVLVHIDDARELTGVSTATALALDVPGDSEAIQQAVQAKLPEGLRAYDLLSLLGAVATRVRISRLLMIPVGVLFAIFAALAVTSTLLVSVMERAQEFGMVAAIGLAPPQLAVMVVMEALVTTTMGWLLGLALGYSLIGLLSRWNLLGPFFSSAAGSLGNYGIGDEIYTLVSPRYALVATATVVLAAVFAILIPARRVRRLHPAQAMRGQ